MMLEVLEPGPQATVQDVGRPGWRHLGVPVGGAADAWSLRVANALLGNDAGDAVLELTLGGVRLRALEDLVLALAGADLGAEVGRLGPVAPGRTLRLEAGDELALRGSRRPGAGGVRAYLAVPGGIDVPEVLGSRSTCLAGSFGGVDGRALRPGDRIAARRPPGGGAAPDEDAVWPGPVRAPHPPSPDGALTVRVLTGPSLAGHGAAELDRLLETDWVAASASDRMGIRLDPARGAPAPRPPAALISGPVVAGAVQIPPDGRPIVLLADHQPTGGYPIAAVAIAADLPALGQVAPGVRVRFVATDPAAARDALRANEDAFAAARSLLRRDARWDELWRSAGA